MSNYVRCIDNSGYLVSLTQGAVYKALPTTELEEGSIRVIDNTGEDYLFDPQRFEPIELSNDSVTKTATIYLPDWMHGVLHAEAVAADKSISSLLRDLIAERFDLPTA
jgi:hypothetical protein